MKLMTTTLATLGLATAASAHTEALPHVHDSHAVFWAVALILAFGVAAYLRSR
jgi:hypothetical protein